MIPGIYNKTTLDKIMRSKDKRDELKGWVEAESDFEAVCMQFKDDFSKLFEFMKSRYVRDGEETLMRVLVKENDPRNEEKIIGQIKRMRQLHKKFMQYGENLQN